MASGNIRVTVEPGKKITQREVIEHLNENPRLLNLLDRLATRVQRHARKLVGVKTGTLLSTIRKNPGKSRTQGPYVDIAAGHPGITPYMWFHHEGTPPHVIRPRTRKALRFMAGGRVVFASKVNHPGTVGTKFLTRAIDRL